jgi:hypothetical protein
VRRLDRMKKSIESPAEQDGATRHVEGDVGISRLGSTGGQATNAVSGRPYSGGEAPRQGLPRQRIRIDLLPMPEQCQLPAAPHVLVLKPKIESILNSLPPDPKSP